MNWKFWQSKYPSETQSVPVGTGGSMIRKTVSGVLALVLTGYVGVGWWWDAEPAEFDVVEKANQYANKNGHRPVTGYVMTHTMLALGDALLEKRGGYLSNDKFPPGVVMDNMPAWEFGVLTQLRDTSRSFRIDLSRSQSQSIEDKDLAEAEPKLSFDNSSWAFPPSESEYRDGIRHFSRYLDRLADPAQPKAQFYARADNLAHWLESVETRLGSLSQRLSASVGKRQLNIDLAGDAAATQSTSAPVDEEYKTPWLELDAVFYEARGYTWALLHLLRAAENDFGDVLDNKNARVSLQQVIRELEPSQQTVSSPMILNGDGMGLLANHSLVMASFVSRANGGITDLRVLLASG
ncbi:MAG: DUF2333 family protein [Gammaproteobacteria bacterium]|nr:DUF2333 family protein [Gammaproteobacteria bacterium]